MTAELVRGTKIYSLGYSLGVGNVVGTYTYHAPSSTQYITVHVHTVDNMSVYLDLAKIYVYLTFEEAMLMQSFGTGSLR